MKAVELLERTRTVSRDTAKPYLFSDELIYSYLTEAQIEFCRRTHMLVDGESHTLALSADQAVYTTPAVVLRVLGARLDGETAMLQPVNTYPRNLAYNAARGKPSAFATDYAHRAIAFHPVPDASYDAVLLVAVLPGQPINESSDPVIPEDWHFALPYYAIAQMTSQIDADAGNPKAMVDFEAKWQIALRDAKRAAYNYRTGETIQVPRIT